jgi:hypothetical protein
MRIAKGDRQIHVAVSLHQPAFTLAGRGLFGVLGILALLILQPDPTPGRRLDGPSNLSWRTPDSTPDQVGRMLFPKML